MPGPYSICYRKTDGVDKTLSLTFQRSTELPFKNKSSLLSRLTGGRFGKKPFKQMDQIQEHLNEIASKLPIGSESPIDFEDNQQPDVFEEEGPNNVLKKYFKRLKAINRNISFQVSRANAHQYSFISNETQ